LRNEVRTELAAGQPRRIGASAPQARRRMLVGPCLAPQHSYWFVAQARPGSPPVRIPKIVDYEFLRYAGDRSPAIERAGQADRSVGAITGCDASCIVLEHYGLAWDATGLDTGSIDGTIVGQGTILNYPTVAVRPRMAWSVRMTSWMAPDLGCFALRITTEAKRPDGALRSVQEKRAALE
jgi:hypothetical protein